MTLTLDRRLLLRVFRRGVDGLPGDWVVEAGSWDQSVVGTLKETYF